MKPFLPSPPISVELQASILHQLLANSVKRPLAAEKAIDDFTPDIHWQRVDGDVVTTYKTYCGTHQGDFLGIAGTGTKVSFETVDAMRVVDGTIREHWGVANLYSVLQQIGVIARCRRAEGVWS